MGMTGVKIAAASAFLSGSIFVADTSLPGVPDDFKSWPVTAILGLICLGCLALCYVMVTRQAKCQLDAIKAQADTAAALAKSAEQETERGRRMDELNGKIGDLVTEMSVTNAGIRATNKNLKERPCIGDKSSLKRTQEIPG